MSKFVIKGLDCLNVQNSKSPYIEEVKDFETMANRIDDLIKSTSLVYYIYFRDCYGKDTLIKWNFYLRLLQCKHIADAPIGFNFKVRPINPFSRWDILENGDLNDFDCVYEPVFHEEATGKYLVIMPEFKDAMPYGDFATKKDIVYMCDIDIEFLGGYYEKNWE